MENKISSEDNLFSTFQGRPPEARTRQRNQLPSGVAKFGQTSLFTISESSRENEEDHSELAEYELLDQRPTLSVLDAVNRIRNSQGIRYKLRNNESSNSVTARYRKDDRESFLEPYADEELKEARGAKVRTSKDIAGNRRAPALFKSITVGFSADRQCANENYLFSKPIKSGANRVEGMLGKRPPLLSPDRTSSVKPRVHVKQVRFSTYEEFQQALRLRSVMPQNMTSYFLLPEDSQRIWHWMHCAESVNDFEYFLSVCE